jgi:hypothetical protein
MDPLYTGTVPCAEVTRLHMTLGQEGRTLTIVAPIPVDGNRASSDDYLNERC